MIQVCVIGNSHVAALKHGYELGVRQSEFSKKIDVTFFASHGKNLNCLALSDGYLTPAVDKVKEQLSLTSGGLDRIKIDEYDIYLLAGMSTFPPDMGDLFYSDAVRRQVIHDLYSDDLTIQILKLLREETKKPIYICHRPFPGLIQDEVRDENMREASICRYNSLLSDINKLVFSNYNVELIEQPSKTINDSFTRTVSDYSKGSVRLERLEKGIAINSEVHPNHDIAHMNPEYGLVYLENFLSTIEKQIYSL